MNAKDVFESMRRRESDALQAGVEMPRYTSHKVVHALKMKEIYFDWEAVKEEGQETDGTAVFIPEETEYSPIRLDAEYVRKHSPKAGGYYVVYDDGYKSWSPAEAFESGYTRL